MRILSALAGAAVAVGAAVMLVALVARPGSWLVGYVSEAGTSGQQFAGAYRTGLILLALGVGALAPGRPRPVSVLLLIAAALGAVSGGVSCSGGCPLPPFEPSTPSDIVHASASVIGMVVLAGAMAFSWWDDRRRITGVALALTVPLGGALGLTMLFAGRNALGAVLERLLLGVAVAWLTTMAANPPHDRQQ